MKIRKKLKLTVAAYVFIALLMGLILYSSSQSVNRLRDKTHIADEILDSVFDLNILTSDYLLHHEKRAEVQWMQKHQSLTKKLSQAQGVFKKSKEKEFLQEIKKENNQIQVLFQKLVQNQQRNETDKALRKEIEDRLVSQLMITSRHMVGKTIDLKHSSNRQLVQAQRQSDLSALLLTLILVGGMIGVVSMIYRGMMIPLTKLHEGTEVIGGGDLDYRLDIDGGEELEQLGRAFNEMAKNLKQSYSRISEGKERINRILESSPDSIVVTDLKGNILECNEATTDMTGYRRDELLDMNALDLISEDEREKALSKMRKTLKEERLKNLEYTLVDRSGKKFPVEMSTAVIKDMQGDVSSFIAVVKDVTDRRKKEKELLSMKKHLETVLDGIDESIVVIDRDYNIISHNRAFASHVGSGRSCSYESQKCFKAIHGFDEPCRECVVRDMFKDKEPKEDTHFHSKDNAKIWHHTRAYPLLEEGDELHQAIYVFEDVSVRKNAEEALRESENKFRSLVNQAAEMLFLHDTDGQIMDVNKAAINNTGYSREELLDMNIFDIDPDAEERRDLEKYWKGVNPEDPPKTFEARHKRKDGSTYPAEITLSKVVLSDGNYILALARDITERKRSQEKLRESEERYRQLVELSPDAIVIHRDGKVVYANPSALDLFKASDLDSALGKPIMDFIHPDSREKVKKRVKKLYEEGETGEMTEEKMYRVDGEAINVEVAMAPVKFHGEKAAQAVIRDITERKKRQQALKEYAEKLEEANEKLRALSQTKSEFISLASHELKTPLAIVKGYADVLSSDTLGGLNQKQLEKIKRISANIDHLTHLVNVMLDISRIERGELYLKKETVNLSQIALKVVDDLENMASKKQIDLKTYIRKDIQKEVDKDRIKEVFMNLVINAIKYTLEEGEVKVSLTTQKDNAVFKVSDTGVGISEEDLKEIFKPFTVGESAYDRKKRGAGLGLAISKKLVEMHGGEIDCESQLDEGTTFTVTLP